MRKHFSRTSLVLVLCGGFALSCDTQQEEKSGDVTWSGSWSSIKDPLQFGTFVLEFKIAGENMELYGGNGSASGILTWKDMQEKIVFEATIEGQWENESESGQVTFSLDLAVPEHSFSFSCYYGASAASIDGNESISGSYTYGDDKGSWQTIESDSGMASAVILDALTVDTSVHLHDITWAETHLYATGYENPDQVIIKIDPENGATQRVESGCPMPKGITYHDSFFWILSAEGELPEAALKLYKYSTSWILEAGYPIDLSLQGQWGSIPVEIAWWDDGIICYISESLADSGIQKIDPATGASTIIVPAGITRALGIAATESNLWTGFHAIGGSRCTLDKRDASGQIVRSFTTPTNKIGPIASESDDIWLYINETKYLYKIDGSK